ncbi:MAG: agmatine deiminase family protein [Myxococcota bacterium]|nr:agmatine deiminase family protein [Myxococcota bacterium]
MTTDEAALPQRPAGEVRRHWPAGEVRRHWPAEWQPHTATWLAWPHARDTWPGRLEEVERTYVELVRALQGRELVRIGIEGDEREARARRVLADGGVDADRGVEFVALPTDDAWLRDTGPVFARCGAEPIALDFRFDSWGGKYPPWQRDDRVARRIAAHVRVAAERVDAVLEGGSIEGNGAGTVLTTESCLLQGNRGGGSRRSRQSMEQLLADRLGARRVLWLGGGIRGDDTDGHVDNVTRFVARDTVVTCVQPDAGDPDHAALAANRDRLRTMRTADDAAIAVIELPLPDPVVHRGQRLPASYANFLLANGVALVPVFGSASDERALAILRDCLSGREVIGIASRDLVIGLGAVHCLTLQEPA